MSQEGGGDDSGRRYRKEQGIKMIKISASMYEILKELRNILFLSYLYNLAYLIHSQDGQTNINFKSYKKKIQ